tara:strand:+ start:2044 stop:2391 length:348 start_codon:yes stop_codon:yes gene_type:complete
MKLAEKLGMSVQETKARISSSEFTMWKAYFEGEHTRFHREDYFFAMIAAEVRRTVVQHPEKVSMEDFLLDFGGGTQKEREEVTEEALERKIEISKSMWMAAVGMDIADNPADEKE